MVMALDGGGGDLAISASAPANWSLFELIPVEALLLEDGSAVLLRCFETGYYLSATDQRITATAVHAGPAEHFTLRVIRDDEALRDETIVGFNSANGHQLLVRESRLVLEAIPDGKLAALGGHFTINPLVDAPLSMLTAGLGGGGSLYRPVISPHDPNVAFVACDMTGLYRCQNLGLTSRSWTMMDTRAVQGSNRFSVAFDPKDPNHLLGSHKMLGLVESHNVGTTWAQVSGPLPQTYPADAAPASLGCSGPPAGATGTSSRTQVVLTAAAICPDQTARWLVGTERGIFRRDEQTRAWTWVYPAGGPVPDERIVDLSSGGADYLNPADVIAFVTTNTAQGVKYFAATTCDVLVSTDGGHTWSSYNTGLPSRPLGAYLPSRSPAEASYDQSRLRGFSGANGPDGFTLWATVATQPTSTGFDGGVYWSDGTATGWRLASGSIGAQTTDPDTGTPIPRYTEVACLPSDPTKAYVGEINNAAVPNVRLAALTPSTGQVIWTDVYKGPVTSNLTPGWLETSLGWGFGGPPHGLAVDARNGETVLYANEAALHITQSGLSTPQWTYAYTSAQPGTDGAGRSRWRTVGLDVTTVWQYVRGDDIYPDAGRFICSTDIGLARSQDGGASWSCVTVPTGTGSSWNNWYAMWQQPTDTGPDSHNQVWWAAVSDQHDIPHETQLGNAPGHGAVLYSNDDGLNWSMVGQCGNGGPVTSILGTGTNAPGTLYATVWGDGVFTSIDSGQSWQRLDSNPSTLPASAFAYRVDLDRTGTPYCIVAADTRAGFAAGGLYRFVADTPGEPRKWQKESSGLEQLLAKQPNPAKLATVDFAFHPFPGRGEVWVCAADIGGSNGGGGVYSYRPAASAPLDPTQGTWTKLPIPFSSVNYNDAVQTFAPIFDPSSVIGSFVYVTSTSHGVWFCSNGFADPSAQTWVELDAIPFLGAQRVTCDRGHTIYISTFGGGVWGPIDASSYVTFTGG